MPFVSSRFGMRLGPVREAPPSQFISGEGHDSESSCEVSRALLLPQGRPGGWLLLVIALWTLVLVHALGLV